MKQNKNALSSDYFALVSPITPRISSIDGFGSIFNIFGTYYDIEPKWEELWKASNHISTRNDAWERIGKDIFEATNQFAELNNLGKTFPIEEYELPKLSKDAWKHLQTLKK